MALTVKNGGDGGAYGWKVDSDGRAHVEALSLTQQHVVSELDELAFQLLSVKAVANSEVKMLLLKNTSDTQNMVITYLSTETIGVAAAGASALWKIYLGGDYASGGTAATPVNLHVNSTKSAPGLFYDATASTIVTSGSPAEIDRNYIANANLTYRKEGSIVLPKNGVLTMSFTGSTVAGTAIARASFYYDTPS
jgi:hypothetical protein